VIPKRHVAATHTLGAPKDWDDGEHGKCVPLAIRMVGDIAESYWEPTPAELKTLNEGGHVVLKVKGGQPPVALSVRPVFSEEELFGKD
jgi:hypothetical protein